MAAPLSYAAVLVSRCLNKKVSPEKLIATLMGVQASIYVHKKTGDRYRVPGSVSHEVTQIYRAFGLTRNQDASIFL